MQNAFDRAVGNKFKHVGIEWWRPLKIYVTAMLPLKATVFARRNHGLSPFFLSPFNLCLLVGNAVSCTWITWSFKR